MLPALLAVPLSLDSALCRPGLAGHDHGDMAETEVLKAGEFRAMPLVSLDLHGGFMTNLEGNPEHYAIDGQFGVAMEWGLKNGGSLTIETAVGPAFVWGEADHFYGKVHGSAHNENSKSQKHGNHQQAGSHQEHSGAADLDAHGAADNHAGHGGEEGHAMQAEQGEQNGHANHSGADNHAEHGGAANHEQHGENQGHQDHSGHSGHGSGFQRTDIRGFLQVRYEPNDRLSVSVDWKPYYVTGQQGSETIGLKNELGASVVWAFGDGEVNFALGDQIEDLIDGVFVSVDHRQGWESDGTWIGNYTDPRLGVGFNIHKLNISLDAGPRFYVPGSYSGLKQRTDWAGGVALAYPMTDSTVLFLHWEPAYSSEGGTGWGEGWQHHIGTGVTFSF
ncbi:MAG: hypothetical protein AB8E74_06645 [Prochlorococcus sp.]